MNVDDGLPLTTSDKQNRTWRRLVKKRLPILEWAPQYDRLTAVADLVAGVTLGLTLVPQSIAYASLANLPVQYGLYSSFIGTMLYVILGTVKEVSIGPTSLMALFTLQICRELPIEFVVLLTFLSGCIVFVMGLLRLGFLVDLISPSVTSGFTSATAIIIVAGQVKGLIGLSFVAESVADNVYFVVSKWRDIRLADCALGAVCCTVLLLLRKLKDVQVSPKTDEVEEGSVAGVDQPERHRRARGFCLRFLHTQSSETNVQVVRSSGAGPAPTLAAAVQRLPAQQHAAAAGHGAPPRQRRPHAPDSHGACQYCHRKGFFCW